MRALEAAAFPHFYGTANIGQIRGIVIAVGVAASAFGPSLLASATTASAPTTLC